MFKFLKFSIDNVSKMTLFCKKKPSIKGVYWVGNKNGNNSIHWVGLEPVKFEIPPPHQKFLRNFQTTLEYIRTVTTALKVTKISFTILSSELLKKKNSLPRV